MSLPPPCFPSSLLFQNVVFFVCPLRPLRQEVTSRREFLPLTFAPLSSFQLWVSSYTEDLMLASLPLTLNTPPLCWSLTRSYSRYYLSFPAEGILFFFSDINEPMSLGYWWHTYDERPFFPLFHEMCVDFRPDPLIDHPYL